MTSSGDAFYVALFADAKKKDAALGKLRLTTYKVGGKVVKLVANTFGAPDKSVIWTIPAGLLRNANDVSAAIPELFHERKSAWTGTFEVKQTLIGNADKGVYSVRFSSPPPWLGKQIMIKGVIKLITAEPAGKCRLCGANSHTSWDCDGVPGSATLGDETVLGMVTAGASASAPDEEMGEEES